MTVLNKLEIGDMNLTPEVILRFSNVSKKYRLGTTRTSVVTAIAETVKSVIRPGSNRNQGDQILWALRDASFELNRGESLALIGKNGAGKSTLLKLLANITRPTLGNIDVHGRVSALIELGSGFHGDLTGRENIFLNGAVMGLSIREIGDRYDEIVEFSELADFIDTPVKRYSSGMLVRLGFAVAATIDPEILLVDEVLAVGDAAFREKCLAKIKTLLDRGTSLIFVSHNINMIEAVCSTGLYIKSGKIESRGRVGHVIEEYEHDLHEERAAKYDLREDRQSHQGGGEVKINSIEILGKDSEKKEVFLGNEMVEIKVHYLSDQDVAQVDAVLRIVRSDGLTCCMLRTAVDNYTLILKRGSGYFSAVLDPLQLIGGKYFVDAFISTPRDLVLLDNKKSDWFYVKGDSQSFEEQSGVYDPLRSWR